MRRVFGMTLAATAIAFTLGAASAQDRLELRIGTEGAYPPFNNLTASGELEGFDIDIARALCEEMDAECTFVTQDWDGIIPALQADRFDAIIASMSITEERRQQVDFTDKYYANTLNFVAPQDADFSPENVGSAVIGVQQGTISASFAEEAYPDADVREYPTQLEAWADMQTGRIDAVLADFGVQYEWIEGEGAECCEFKGEAVSSDDEIGIAVRKGDTELVERFNAAIGAIRENGVYKEINDRYFPFDVYGG